YPALGLRWGGGRKGGLLIVLRVGTGLLALRAGRIGGTLARERIAWADPAPEDTGLPVAARLGQGGRSLRLIDPGRLELGRGMGFTGLADAGML
ncbi:hypothetical protein QPL65_24860, partial [Escherichia coli]|uniref:hypothetical protein n=1 Tax=Escherichia coli TaxID=562 RepID=UPI002702EEED